MSDNKNQPAPAPVVPPAPPTPPTKPENSKVNLLSDAIDHLKKCREYQFSVVTTGEGETAKSTPRFHGIAGFNPSLYCAQVLAPLEAKLDEGSISESELRAILQIKVETPPDGNAIKVTTLTLRQYIKQCEDAKAGKKI